MFPGEEGIVPAALTPSGTAAAATQAPLGSLAAKMTVTSVRADGTRSEQAPMPAPPYRGPPVSAAGTQRVPGRNKARRTRRAQPVVRAHPARLSRFPQRRCSPVRASHAGSFRARVHVASTAACPPRGVQVILEKGHSQMDWMNLTRRAPDLAGLGGGRPRKLTLDEARAARGDAAGTRSACCLRPHACGRPFTAVAEH